MSSAKPNEASIFNIARKIESTADREVYLTETCQGNAALRDRIDKLLLAFAAESQFLELPAAGLEATMHLDRSIQDREGALQAGLAAAFTVDEAILLGDGNHSVLKMLGQTLANVPRVALRESAGEGADPIMRPKSTEMPDRHSDNRYQLQGEIARGGMGAILKGRDTDLGRDLAIKVLLDTHRNKPEVVQWFIEEAQIGGQLQHPGIAPIYELGQFADKRPFFAMKLIKGKTLSVLLAERPEPATDRAKFVGIFEQVCQTMAYVHSRGVIHRDLKPANIMVGAFGEVQVMDWGLAKVLKSGGTEDEKKSHQLQQGQSIVQTLLTVASAAGVLLMISLGCSGRMWRVFDQAERRTAVMAKINNALNDAQLHRSLADAADLVTPTQELADVAALGSRLKELEKAVDAAKRAVEYAEEGDITADVHSSATSLLADLNEKNASVAKIVEQTNRVRIFQKELERIRLSQADGSTIIDAVDNDRNFDFVSANDRYEQVFRDAGLDLTVLEMEEAVSRIRESKICESLIVAIDNWIRSIASLTTRESFIAATEDENWKLAAKVGRELLISDPGTLIEWLRLAPVFLLAKDNDAYRNFCTMILAKFDSMLGLSPSDAEILCKALVLSCESFDLSQMPIQALGPSQGDGAISLATRGLIAYRSGDSELAVQYLQEGLLRPQGEMHKVEVFAVLAMSKRQLGQFSESREALEQATQLFDRLLKGSKHKPHSDTGTFLAHSISLLLLREAQSQLITESAMGENQRNFGNSGPEIVPALIRRRVFSNQSFVKSSTRPIAASGEDPYVRHWTRAIHHRSYY